MSDITILYPYSQKCFDITISHNPASKPNEIFLVNPTNPFYNYNKFFVLNSPLFRANPARISSYNVTIFPLYEKPILFNKTCEMF